MSQLLRVMPHWQRTSCPENHRLPQKTQSILWGHFHPVYHFFELLPQAGDTRHLKQGQFLTTPLSISLLFFDSRETGHQQHLLPDVSLYYVSRSGCQRCEPPGSEMYVPFISGVSVSSYFLAPHCQSLDLCPVQSLITHYNKINNDCVVSKCNNVVGWVDWGAVIGVKGVKQRTQYTTL